MRKRTAAVIAAATVTLLLAPLESPSLAQSVEQRVADAAGDLEDSTAALQAADAELRQVAAELPGAEREASVARGELEGARALAAEAAEQARVADLALQAGRQRVAEATARVEESRRLVGELAGQAYRRGPLDVQPILEPGDATDFLERSAMLEQVAVSQNGSLDRLSLDRVALGAAGALRRAGRGHARRTFRTRVEAGQPVLGRPLERDPVPTPRSRH